MSHRGGRARGQITIEIGRFDMFIETDFGFRHKLPAISGAIQLVNKHGFDSFLAVTNCYKSF